MFKLVPSRIASILALLCVIVGGYTSLNFIQTYINTFSITPGRYSAQQLADSLRQTSDDLTRMVRLYAMTGDPVYRDYFNEILAIRNGDAPRPEDYFNIPYWDVVLATGERPGEYGAARPIRTLIRLAHFADEELALLDQVEDSSNELTLLENEVMDVVAAQIEAGGGDYQLEGAALEATQRLFGDEYAQAKLRIMQPLVDLAAEVDDSLAEYVVWLRQHNARTYSTIVGSLALGILLSAAGIWLRRRDHQVAGM